MNNGTTYYTDEIHDVLLNGIADIDIRRKALSILWHSKRAVNDIIAFVEWCEIACNAHPAGYQLVSTGIFIYMHVVGMVVYFIMLFILHLLHSGV